MIDASPGALALGSVEGQAPARPEPGRGAGGASPVRLLPVQGNVSMLVGSGGNVAVQTGRDGVLLVDTMGEDAAQAIAAQVKALTALPIRFIVNTSLDADHVGGNAALGAMGATGARPVPGGGATVIAHENVVKRLARPTPGPQPGLPNDEYFTPSKDFSFNGEAVFVLHVPAAHTDGDSIVLFRRSDVIATGDIFTPDRYPVPDLERGGSVQGLLDGLNRVLALAVPERLQDGGTRVVPGHGRLCNEADVVEYRDMVTIVRDRIADLIRKGSSLEQVRAARPTLDYDGSYGDPRRFIDAVYASLTKGSAS
ncbi:MAG: MBL fold metallo-hydrolase [Acidimicrobiia bacterium]|nr:MBL fold metallo-hydrolase [Acidimicrobiia bacterium]